MISTGTLPSRKYAQIKTNSHHVEARCAYHEMCGEQGSSRSRSPQAEPFHTVAYPASPCRIEIANFGTGQSTYFSSIFAGSPE